MSSIASHFHTRTARWLVAAAVMGLLLAAWSSFGSTERVAADHNPPGCTANNLTLDVNRKLAPGQSGPADGSVVSPGQKILYTVTVRNHNGDGCDMSYADVHIDMPAMDGKPGPLGTPLGGGVFLGHLSNCTIVDEGRTLGHFPVANAATCNTTYPPVEYVVDVNPGVTNVTIRAHLIAADGKDTPDVPHDRHAVELAKALSSEVIYPDLEISKTPDRGMVDPGEPAVFNITVINNGPGVATDVAIDDELPAGYTWTESPDTAECAIANDTTLHCDLGDMAQGDSYTVSVQADTDPNVPQCVIENIAYASAGNHEEIFDFGDIRCSGAKVSSTTSYSYLGGDDDAQGPINWGLVALTTLRIALAGLVTGAVIGRLRAPGRGA